MYEISMEIYMRNGGTHYEITYRYPRIACPYDISVCLPENQLPKRNRQQSRAFDFYCIYDFYCNCRLHIYGFYCN